MARHVSVQPDPPVTLHEVVVRLEAALHPLGEEQPPILVGVRDAGDLELRIPPERAGNVVDALVGVDAPSDWSAVGLLSAGRAHHLGGDVDLAVPVPAVTAAPRRVRIGHFVARTGTCVSFLRFAGSEAVFDNDRHEGRIDDVCRRMLGLATAPPGVTVEAYWASLWMQQVLAVSQGGDPEAARWGRIALLHPAAAGCGAPPSVPRLVERGLGLAVAAPWALLRVRAARGTLEMPGIDPASARWMDEGMFSRWVTADLVPLGRLRAAVADSLPPATAEAVEVALRGWGLT